MNVKTNIYYYLSYMYRYINDIYIICSNKQLNDYKEFAVSYIHSINNDLLKVKKYIECYIDKKILNNPQLLLENEYDDIV